ncbi:hypothetical protein VTH06DRAFT_96 [Thermothelomyces fergusii]
MGENRATTSSVLFALAVVNIATAISSLEISDSSAQPSARPTTPRKTGNEDAGASVKLPIFVIAISSTAIGTCVLTVFGYYLFLRRRSKRRACGGARRASAAPKQIVARPTTEKGPEVQVLSAPEGQQPAQSADTHCSTEARSQPEMTPAVVTKADDSGTTGPCQPQPKPPTLPVGETRPAQRRGTPLTEATHAESQLRRMASSHLMDSAERVYACILASPLERVGSWPSPQEQKSVPVARDDVGWPLPPGESWA